MSITDVFGLLRLHKVHGQQGKQAVFNKVLCSAIHALTACIASVSVTFDCEGVCASVQEV